MPLTSFETFLQPTLTQLPNNDLWRGVRIDTQRADNLDNAENAPATGDGPIDRALAAIKASSKDSHTLSCLWCGVQFARSDSTKLAEHLATQHRAALTPVTDTDKLAAALQVAGVGGTAK